MLSDREADSYVPKDASEESVSVSNILSSIRSRLDEPVKTAEKEIKEISSIISNSSQKEKLVKQLQASVPKSLKSGSVGEGIYACVAPTVDGVPSVCTPSCQTNSSGVILGECAKQVFTKKEEEEIVKLNKTNSTSACVYLSGSASASASTRSRTSSSSSVWGLSSKDVEKLKSSGVEDVEIFVSEGSNTWYRKTCSVSLRKDDSTHYSKNSQCDPTEKYCEEESCYNWMLLIGIVVFLIVVAFFFAAWYWYPSASAVTTTSSICEKEVTRAPYSFE